METRRFLNTYKIKNTTSYEIHFKLTLARGLTVDQTLGPYEQVRGINRRGLDLLQSWIIDGYIVFEKEWEIIENKTHNWQLDGF